MNAGEEISIYTPKRVIISAQNQLFLKKTSKASGFSMEGEYHFLGNAVVAEGRDRTAFAPFNDEPQKGKPPEPKKFDMGKLALNILGGLAVVAVVAVAAAVTVATFGAGAALITAVATGAVIGGVSAVAGMVFSDIRNGEVSDFGDYAWAAVRESVIGAISGAIFGPFGPAATTAGKMTIGAINNGFESVLRQTLNHEKINPLVVLFDAGLGALTAGVIDSKYGKQIGEAVDDAAPWLKNGMNKMMDCIEDNSNKLANLMGNNNQLVPAVLGLPSNFMNSVDDNVHTPMRSSTSEAGGSGANGKAKTTTPECRSKVELEANPFDEHGNLKPNIKYTTGEYDYLYETDDMGRISKFETDDLQLTDRDKRLPHNPNTPGKLDGDHAGHLAGDRFGGSPDLDNIVSQSSNINLSQYKKIENQWAKAINEGKNVKVNVEVKYDGESLRPSKFDIDYEIDGELYSKSLLN